MGRLNSNSIKTDSMQKGMKIYNKRISFKRIVIVFSFFLVLLVSLFAIVSGSMELSFKEVLQTLAGKSDAQNELVVFSVRLPRIAASLLVGAALAVCGAVMQCVLQNPLASASTLGVSQGAGFGAALGIVVFGGGVVSSGSANVAIEINNPYIVTLSAFFFGSLSTLVILLLFRFKRDLGAGGLILAGVALSSLFTGGSTLLQYFADETQLGAVVFWTFGNLGSASWTEIAIIGAVFAAAFAYFMFNRWNYNAMCSGQETAKSLGVNTTVVMLLSMAIASLTAAVSVAFVGIINFIGLVAPHIMRKFVGDDYRFLIPASAVAGGLLLLTADTFGRLIIAPVILPVGAITSFLGAPLFLWLLMRGDRRND